MSAMNKNLQTKINSHNFHVDGGNTPFSDGSARTKYHFSLDFIIKIKQLLYQILKKKT